MKKILLFHYFGGAGGKFITNCLTYSGKVAFQNFSIAKKIIEQKNNLQILEENLLYVIPEKHQRQTWFSREPGCVELFGDKINSIKYKSTSQTAFNPVEQLGDVWLPIMTHSADEFINCLNYFSKDSAVVTVLVDGNTTFIDLAIKAKWPEEHHCLDLDAYHLFCRDLTKLKFDFIFNNWNPLDSDSRQQISKFANYLGFNFNLHVADNFINKYIEFHL